MGRFSLLANLNDITVLDLETSLIRPGLRCPPPAIATTYHPRDGKRLWYTHQLAGMFDRVLQGTVLGQTLAFDMSVIGEWFPSTRPAIWAAYEEGRILDTHTAERIIEIQTGGGRQDLSLPSIARKRGVEMPDKEGRIQEIRTSFGQYIGATSIPQDYADYALDDATIPYEIFQRQLQTNLVSIADLTHFTRQHFWLNMVSNWGFRTDLEHVRIFESRVRDHMALLDQIATANGYLRSNGVKDTKAIKRDIARAFSGDWQSSLEELVALDDMRGKDNQIIPRSKSGLNVATDRVTLEDSGYEPLEDLATWSQWRAAAAKDVELLYRGTLEPLHVKFGMTDTGRASHSNPNAANFAKGKAPKDASHPAVRNKVWGVRECLSPRPGMAYGTTDAKALEMCSIAECIRRELGRYDLVRKLQSGMDIHCELAADMLGISYEETIARRKVDDDHVEEYRDASKPGGFGLNGGMSRWQTLQGYARKSYGVRMSEEMTKAVIAAWQRKAVDRKAWVDHAETKRNAVGRYDVQLPNTSIVRRNVARTVACNTPFQAFGMFVMSYAGWDIVRAQKLTGQCPGNVVFFTHDDFTTECKPDEVHEACAYHEKAISEAGQELAPEIPWVGESRALTHLSKGARATRDAAGRLQVTEVRM